MRMSEQAMREYVVQLVRKTVTGRNLPERPTSEQVVEALGLPRPKHVRISSDRDGYRSGRQIFINNRTTVAERIEFTVFHEILHILLEEDGEITSELHEHAHVDQEGADRMEETLCNMGAAEFIMPNRAFTTFMGRYAWQIAAVENAAAEYKCSITAAAFQFAHWSPKPCTVLICEYGPLPPDRTGTENPLYLEGVASLLATCLHVAYAPCHPESYTMCRNARVPNSHLIYRAWQTHTTVSGEDYGFFRERKDWKMPCDAVRIGKRVYGVFYARTKAHNPVAMPDKRQLSLF